MICPNCGTPLPDNMKFCTGCGTPLAAAPAEQPQTEQPVIPQQAAEAQFVQPEQQFVQPEQVQQYAQPDYPQYYAQPEQAQQYAQPQDAQAAPAVKKKSKLPIIIIIILLLAGIGAGVYFLAFADKDDDDDDSSKRSKSSSVSESADEDNNGDKESSEDEESTEPDESSEEEASSEEESSIPDESSEPEPESSEDDSTPIYADTGEFIGEWTCVAIEQDGRKITIDDLDDPSTITNVLAFTINEGGTGSAVSNGRFVELTWKIKDSDPSVIVLTIQGEDREATLIGDELRLPLGENMTYLRKGIIVPEKPDSSEPDDSSGPDESSEPDKPAGDTSIVGTWIPSAMDIEGKKYDADNEIYGSIIREMMTIKIRDDGKAEFIIKDTNEEVDWTLEGTKLTLSKGGSSIEGEFKDGQLRIDFNGNIVYYEKS